MPELSGIAETTLFVADVEPARTFYEDVFGLEPFHHDEHGAAYEVAADQLLLVVSREKARRPSVTPGGEIPPCLASPGEPLGAGHVAFRVPREGLAAWRTRLADFGVEIAGDVAWERGGHSLYVRDPDGHLVELATPGIWDVR